MQVERGVRRERDGEADQAEGAKLEADEQRGQRTGRSERKLRKPGVQRNERHLDAKAKQAEQEYRGLR